MLRRFAAACVVASTVIAIAAIIVQIFVNSPRLHLAPALKAWCVIPLLWGLWAMAAPSKLFPKYLPAWGALLGLVLSTGAIAVLDMPRRVIGQSIGVSASILGILFATALYFALWHIVRVVYTRLERQPALKASA